MITVKRGVVAFNIELTDAVICDCPQAIKLNGITLLNKLIIKNIKNSLLLILKFNFRIRQKHKRKSAAIKTLKKTMVNGETVSRAYSIHIYEPPHNKDSTNNLIQSNKFIIFYVFLCYCFDIIYSSIIIYSEI